jgi:hypothetical protein
MSTGLSDSEKPTAARGVKTTNPPAALGGSKTIEEFCRDHRISRSFWYKMKRLGVGPDEMRHGTAVRITFEAEARWRQQGEQRAKDTAAT